MVVRRRQQARRRPDRQRRGRPVELTAESAGKALAAAKPAGTGNDLALKLDYATKEAGAYPIILVTYEIACSKGLPAEKTALVKSFLSYFASNDGQASLTDLDYAPLPKRSGPRSTRPSSRSADHRPAQRVRPTC